MFSSIKAKIILFYIAVLFFVLSVLGIFLYFSLNKIVYKSLDAGLLAKAECLPSFNPAACVHGSGVCGSCLALTDSS